MSSSPFHRNQRLAHSKFNNNIPFVPSDDGSSDSISDGDADISSRNKEAVDFSKHRLTGWYDFKAIESRLRFYRFYQQAAYQQPGIYVLLMTSLVIFMIPISGYDLLSAVRVAVQEGNEQEVGIRVILSGLAVICAVFALLLVGKLVVLQFGAKDDRTTVSKMPWLRDIQGLAAKVSVAFRPKKVVENSKEFDEEASMEDPEMKTTHRHIDVQQRSDSIRQWKGVLSTLLQVYVMVLLVQKLFRLHCLHDHVVQPHSLLGYWLSFLRTYDDCSEGHESDVLPYAYMALLLPLVSFLAIPGLPIFTVWMNLIVSYVTFVVMVLASNSASPILMTIGWFWVTLVVLKEVQLRNMHHFVHITGMNKRSQELLREQRKQSNQELHTVMMYLNQSLNPLHCRLQKDIEQVQESVLSVDIALPGLPELEVVGKSSSGGSSPAMKAFLNKSKHINNTMMTVLHQYADYLKFKLSDELTSREETVAWLGVVEESLASMQALHPAVHIELEVLSEEICSHITTDKQWLEESILTNLSHAVSVANSGQHVTLRVSVVEFEDDDGRHLIHSCRAQLSSPYRRNTKWKQVETRSPASTINSATTKPSKRVHPQSGLSSISLDHHSMATSGLFPSSQPGLSNQLGLCLHIETAASNKNKKYFLLFEVEFVDEARSVEVLPSFLEAEELDSQHPSFGMALHWFLLAKRMQALDGRCGINSSFRTHRSKRRSTVWFSIPYLTNEVVALQSQASTPYLLHAPSMDTTVTNARGVVPGSRRFNSALWRPLEGLASSSVDYGAPINQSASMDVMQSSRLVRSAMQLLVIELSSSAAVSSLSNCSLSALLPAQVFQKYAVTTATSVEAAVQLVTDRWKSSETCFDAIIFEIQLPVQKTLDLVHKLRKLELPGQIVSSTWEREVKGPLPRQKLLAVSSLPDRDIQLAITTSIAAISSSIGAAQREAEADVVVDLVLEVPCNIRQFDDKMRQTRLTKL